MIEIDATLSQAAERFLDAVSATEAPTFGPVTDRRRPVLLWLVPVLSLVLVAGWAFLLREDAATTLAGPGPAPTAGPSVVPGSGTAVLYISDRAWRPGGISFNADGSYDLMMVHTSKSSDESDGPSILISSASLIDLSAEEKRLAVPVDVAGEPALLTGIRNDTQYLSSSRVYVLFEGFSAEEAAALATQLQPMSEGDLAALQAPGINLIDGEAGGEAPSD